MGKILFINDLETPDLFAPPAFPCGQKWKLQESLGTLDCARK